MDPNPKQMSVIETDKLAAVADPSPIMTAELAIPAAHPSMGPATRSARFIKELR
jgi:hypothetical protein